MTKSRERGENEITDEARRRQQAEGRDLCAILAEMLADARANREEDRVRKIIRAQKYPGCRNVRKRRGR